MLVWWIWVVLGIILISCEICFVLKFCVSSLKIFNFFGVNFFNILLVFWVFKKCVLIEGFKNSWFLKIECIVVINFLVVFCFDR